MNAVYRREIRAYFTGMTAYVFIAFLLLFAGIYTMAYNLTSAYPNFEYVLQSMSIIFLIAIPILTMRVIAEERRQKTDQLLYALPIGMTRVVLGKYLAMITVVAIPCVIMGFYPLILRSFGNVPLGTAYGTLLATDTAAREEQTELRRVAEKKSRLLDKCRSESACGATGQRVRAVEEAIRAAGHWTAYCAWLTRMGDEARFRGWMGFHENDLERFAEWFGSEGEKLIDREFDR